MRNELEDFLGTNIEATAIKGNSVQHSRLESDGLKDAVTQHIGDIYYVATYWHEWGRGVGWGWGGRRSVVYRCIVSNAWSVNIMVTSGCSAIH